MDDLQRALLDRRRAILLPETIDHSAYETLFYMLSYAADTMPDARITLMCKGDGGDVWSAPAIIQAIQSHGLVDGVLNGPVMSVHATIWAGCARRYTTAQGALGIHPCSRGELTGYYTADALAAMAREMHEVDRRTLELFASLCKPPYDHKWWHSRYHGASRGLFMIYAAELVEMDMATFWQPEAAARANGHEAIPDWVRVP